MLQKAIIPLFFFLWLCPIKSRYCGSINGNVKKSLNPKPPWVAYLKELPIYCFTYQEFTYLFRVVSDLRLFPYIYHIFGNIHCSHTVRLEASNLAHAIKESCSCEQGQTDYVNKCKCNNINKAQLALLIVLLYSIFVSSMMTLQERTKNHIEWSMPS